MSPGSAAVHPLLLASHTARWRDAQADIAPTAAALAEARKAFGALTPTEVAKVRALRFRMLEAGHNEWKARA